MSDILKLYSTPQIIDLQELQNELEKEGIKSSTSEDNSTFISPTGDITTFSLFVREEDYEKALVILKSFREHAKNVEELTWCEYCGSEDVSKEIIGHEYSSIWFLIVGVIMMVASFIGRNITMLFTYLLLIGGLLFIIQYFRGYKEEIYTCNTCKKKFHKH